MLEGRAAVFLDRDGVINKVVIRDGKPMTLGRPEDLEFLPGVQDALGRLRKAELALFVVTNQPDVARGLLDVERVNEIHRKMNLSFPFDGIYTCTHDDKDRCDCRKPKPGLILKAAREHGIALASSFMVGDRARDIDAGRAAGCTTFLVQKPYSGTAQADHAVRDLPEAARIILECVGGET